MLAVLMAVVHFLFYYYMNGRKPALIERVYWAQTIGNGFSYAVKASLTGSIGIAYVQHLWQLFRSKPIQVSTIDELLSLPFAPLNLFSIDVIRTSALSWGSGIVGILISLATIFPPASLNTLVLPPVGRELAAYGAPNYNSTMRINNTWKEINSRAVFLMDTDLLYQ
jgi:hypothetical protein